MRRIVTWRGAEVAAADAASAAAQLGLPANAVVLLPATTATTTGQESADFFLYEKRQLDAGCPPPAPPPPAPPPLPDPPPAGATHALQLARADALHASARSRLQAIGKSVRLQQNALAALAAALGNLREASAQGEARAQGETLATRDGWRVVARAVAAERNAYEALPVGARGVVLW